MDVYVIFGAAVGPDGKPSGAVRRRTEAALTNSRNSAAPIFLVTGSGSPGRPTEAAVMSALLQARGVPPESILSDPVSSNTLSSVIHCAAIIKRQPEVRSVVVCSDTYHIPRCRWLFHLMGVPTRAADVPSGLGANGYLRWAYYFAREAVAFVPNTMAALLARRREAGAERVQ